MSSSAGGPSDAAALHSSVAPSVLTAEGLLAFQSLSPPELGKLPKATKLEILRELRARPLRLPLLVSLCATDLVLTGGGGGKSLGDEQWTIAEQGVVASLECGNVDNATALHKKLRAQFTDKSIRVRKLSGLIQECKGDVTAAMKTYALILRDAPGEAFVVKRQVAVLKSRGMYEEAIAMLETKNVFASHAGAADSVEYTFFDIHRGTSDDAHRELLVLHYLTGRIDRAVRCAEEAVLMDPYSFAHHCRHAELLYAAGNMERAAAVYAHSLRLNDGTNNVRAMYGLWLVAAELAKAGGAAAGAANVAGADAKAMQGYAASRLKQAYTDSPVYASLAIMLQRFA